MDLWWPEVCRRRSHGGRRGADGSPPLTLIDTHLIANHKHNINHLHRHPSPNPQHITLKTNITNRAACPLLKLVLIAMDVAKPTPSNLKLIRCQQLIDLILGYIVSYAARPPARDHYQPKER